MTIASTYRRRCDPPWVSNKERRVMGLDNTDEVLLYTILAAAVFMIWAIVVFIVELRRSGSTPWTEFYNDRVVPMFRGRQKHA